DTDGSSWQQAKGLDINRIRPYSVLQDKTNPDTMYLGTNIGIYKSLDRGVSWTLMVAPKPPVKRTTGKKAPMKATAQTKAKTEPQAPAAASTSRTRIAAPGTTTPSGPATIPALTTKVNVLTLTDDGKSGILAGTDDGVYRTYDVTKGWERLSLGDGINS